MTSGWLSQLLHEKVQVFIKSFSPSRFCLYFPIWKTSDGRPGSFIVSQHLHQTRKVKWCSLSSYKNGLDVNLTYFVLRCRFGERSQQRGRGLAYQGVPTCRNIPEKWRRVFRDPLTPTSLLQKKNSNIIYFRNILTQQKEEINKTLIEDICN